MHFNKVIKDATIELGVALEQFSTMLVEEVQKARKRYSPNSSGLLRTLDSQIANETGDEIPLGYETGDEQ